MTVSTQPTLSIEPQRRMPLEVVRRTEKRFLADDRRVITRLFIPGSEGRIRSILARVAALDESTVHRLLEGVLANFSSRHKNLEGVFEDHYRKVCSYVGEPGEVSQERKLLIGAYFTCEYSIEAAALFNPSIVPHPNQKGVPDGSLRFLMSLRATGEGHLSSIVFRTGMLDEDCHITFDKVSPYARTAKQKVDRTYDKHTFRLKLIEMGAFNDMAQDVLDQLGDLFTLHELSHANEQVRTQHENEEEFNPTAEDMMWLARSNYHLELPPGVDPSEVVIFPTAANESKGIEDVRLVRYTEDDGSTCYFGTYTAYDGTRSLPQIIETADFRSIEVHTLNGKFAQNKGMAFFPRKVNGKYMMIGRVDGENMYLLWSDNLHFWNDAQLLQAPRFPWEFMQIGNCGSPIETDAGWLLLTHGVGPMRRYCIAASLLDLDDPSKLIGQLAEPLIVPTEQERDGYVPNVVYSCGGLVHHDQLVIPYAMADSATSFATVPVRAVLDHMVR